MSTPSQYLTIDELPDYGAPSGSTLSQIRQASALIDAYLKRPEGLVYIPDSTGNPLFMKALPVTQSYRIPAGLAPGLNVVATVTGPTNSLKVGDVLVANKDDLAAAELLEIVTLNGGVAQFRQVNNVQPGACTLDAGLTIFETKQFPTQRPIMLASRNPVRRVIAAQGRYSYSRRGSGYASNLDFNLLAIQQQFGGPAIWESINVANMDVNVHTGELWIPSGMMMAYYSEVRLSYLAGFPESPTPVKLACAEIMAAQQSSPMRGNTKLLKAGDTQIERFIASIMSDDIKLSLEPYLARSFA